MQTTVVIVTYNNQATIGDCLRSISGGKNTSILVVDNNSTDATVKIVKQDFPQVEIIKSPKNLGYAGGNNLGIEYCLKNTTDYILILNPDTILFPDTINILVKTARKLVNQGIFGPKLFTDTARITIWSAGGKLDQNRYTAGLIGYLKPDIFRQDVKCDFISGTCMLLPVKLLKIGLRFYEPYFLYYEDVEFCQKAKILGYPSVFVPEAEIIHSESSKISLNTAKNYYLARNHLLFVERNAPFKVKLRELVRLPKTYYDHLKKHDGKSVAGLNDYFLKKFGSL